MNRAFTLIETLVAISVLLMALIGPLAIASQSLRSAFYARDQVTAFYLGQEGVEYVRAYRDQNYLASQSWLSGITMCEDTPCMVDFPNFTHTPCINGECEPLRISEAGGLFNHSDGEFSRFTRSVELRSVPGEPDQRIVSVTVSWISSGIPRTFTIQERLFDWL